MASEETRPRTILILRHAEKPDDDTNPDLSPAGYQRAISLARLIPAEFGKPDYLFAARKSRASNRCVETLTPLSQTQGLDINSDFPDRNYAVSPSSYSETRSMRKNS